MLQLRDHMSKQMQPFQIKQWWLLGWKRTWCRRVGGPTSGNGSVVTVEVSNDQVGIRTATNTEDLHLLAAERMIGMSDGHPSPNSWGQWGSVLWVFLP